MSKVLVYGCSSEADGNGRKRRPCEVKKDDFLSPFRGLCNRASDMAVLFTND